MSLTPMNTGGLMIACPLRGALPGGRAEADAEGDCNYRENLPQAGSPDRTDLIGVDTDLIVR